MQYQGLAEIYDQLMAGVDYDEWAAYIALLVDRHGGVPCRTALDLACGTGNTTLALARLGYRVIGLDFSAEMLACASRKKESTSSDIYFIRADMRCFSLPEPVGLAVAFQDGLNYLISEDDLQKTFCAVSRSLLPGSLFVFDINLVEKLAGNRRETTCLETEAFTLIWEAWFAGEGVWEISLTGFVPVGRGLYRRFREVHRERAIPDQEVSRALQAAGFELLARYAAFSLDCPGEETRRVFYVAKKEGGGHACGSR